MESGRYEAATLVGGTDLDGESTHTLRPTHEREDAIPSKKVGRYVLLERIGAGGMGLVFAAFDPDLDRKVAVKVLRGSGSSDESRARLQREAQALARLDHPNVVRVFDVGTADGRVYIAMELVDGPTLKRWLADGGSSWRERLGILLDAGRGLQAAHVMGVVHRDFKPDNVLVGTDGRTRVTDFGLAQGAGGPPVSSWSSGHSQGWPERALDATALTRVGTVMGTPAYMAPEQHRGERATASSDQYAFCLSCYEALFGERPFSARSPRELARLKTRGRLPAPEPSHVPPAVRRVVERGLAPDPAQRWPSMRTLLDELERAASVHASRWVVPTTACCIVGLASAWALWPSGSGPCSGASERLASAWSERHRSSAAAAFERSGLPYAEDTWARVGRSVDAYANAWLEAYTHACEAARRGEGPPDLLDRRMACLGDRLAELESLGSLLSDADEDVVEHGIEATTGLTPVRVCEDPPRLRSESAHPADPSLAPALEVVRRRSARVDVLLDAGKHDWALEEAEAVLASAMELGDPSTIAAARHALGSAYERSGRYVEATSHLEEAYWEAEAAGATRVAAHAAIDLVWVLGHRAVELERSLEWGRHARAALDRLGETGFDEARLALSLGSSLTSAGEHARARRELGRAVALFERSVGSDHPEVATALNNLASSLLIEGRYDEARVRVERALEMYLHSHGPEHPLVANAMINLAGIEQRTGHQERAIELGQRALQIRIAALGRDHPDVATVRNNVGAAYSAMGDYANAERHYHEAVDTLARVHGDDHPNTAAARINLGLVVERQGRYDEALEVLRPAFETLVATLPAGHTFIAFGQLGLGRAELGRGRHDRAGAWLDAAFERCGEDTDVDPAVCAWVSFERARVRWHTESTREAALAEAKQALQRLHEADTPAEVAHAEAWLRARAR